MVEAGTGLAVHSLFVNPHHEPVLMHPSDYPLILEGSAETTVVPHTNLLLTECPQYFRTPDGPYQRLARILLTQPGLIDQELLIQNAWLAEEQPSDVAFENDLHQVRLRLFDNDWYIYTAPGFGCLIALPAHIFDTATRIRIPFPENGYFEHKGLQPDFISRICSFTLHKQGKNHEENKHHFINILMKPPLFRIHYEILTTFVENNFIVANESIMEIMNTNKSGNVDSEISRMNKTFKELDTPWKIVSEISGITRRLQFL